MSKDIENHVRVNLHRDAGADSWEIDPTTLDGFPLDGRDTGDVVYAYTAPRDEVRADLDAVPLPSGRELLRLLLTEVDGERLRSLVADCHEWIAARVEANKLEETGAAAKWEAIDEQAYVIAEGFFAAMEDLGIGANR